MESSNLNEEVLSKWDDVWPHFTMAVKQHRCSQWNLQSLTIVSNSVLFHSVLEKNLVLTSVSKHFEHGDEKVDLGIET